MIAVPIQPTAIVTGCLCAIDRAINNELWHRGDGVVGTERGHHHGFKGDYDVCDVADSDSVAPGVIERLMSAAVNAQMKRQRANVPMARMGEPSEIARVVTSPASPATSNLTGSIVDVNGGWIC